jgi:hypothetical protein
MHVRWSQLCKLREQRVPGTGSPYQRIAPAPAVAALPPPAPAVPPLPLLAETAADVEGERLPVSARTTLYVRSNRNRLKSTTSLMVNISCSHLPALVVIGWPLLMFIRCERKIRKKERTRESVRRHGLINKRHQHISSSSSSSSIAAQANKFRD